MEAFRWRGQQLCLPQNVSSLAVYYNRDLFAKYGVAEPKAGWTWNDLVATAHRADPRRERRDRARRRVRRAAARRSPCYGLGVEPTLIRLAPFVWSNGGEIVDDPSARRPGSRSTRRGAARRSQDFVDLRLAYGVVPTDEEVEAEDDEARFANGRLAMLLSSRRVTTDVPDDQGLRVGRRAAADVRRAGRHPALRRVLHDQRRRAHKDAAWRFVEFALGPEGQRIIAGDRAHRPVATSRWRQSPAFLDPAQPPAQLAGLPRRDPDASGAVPTISTWPEIEDATGGILENALYRGDRLDEVIRRARRADPAASSPAASTATR